jgi:hypothetical protein
MEVGVRRPLPSLGNLTTKMFTRFHDVDAAFTLSINAVHVHCPNQTCTLGSCIIVSIPDIVSPSLSLSLSLFFLFLFLIALLQITKANPEKLIKVESLFGK